MTAATIAIDGHVHLRDPARDADALQAAARNFAQWAKVDSRIGVLMLAEAGGENAFSRLATRTRTAASLACRVTGEAESLWIDVSDWRLLVVAGQQLVTREGLEVLALATVQRHADGLPLDALLEQLEATEALAVLPWGCGKWLGARRRCVEAALAGPHAARLLLGDNGNRPRAWPEPLFRGGRPVLRGTDPLPLPGHWRHIGRFGSLLDTVPSEHRPAADLRRALLDAGRLRPYGPHEQPGRFLLGQARLRLARATPRPAA